MTEVEIAERIAREAHAGQVDKHGQPYILHVERVAAAVSEPAKAAAWLHDVIEDTWWTFGALRQEGISVKTAAMVALLTRFGDDAYQDYIDRIAELATGSLSPAVEIKLADIRDNLGRFDSCPTCPESLRSRYLKALDRLTGEARG